MTAKPASSRPKTPLPRSFAPQLATLVDEAPEGAEWLHEIKWDGYRIVALIESGKVKLLTRNGNDWTRAFPSIVSALAHLSVDSAIVDGEVVVLDADGRSDFQALQAMLKSTQKVQPCLYAFDLPFVDGHNLTSMGLLHRKDRLESLLAGSGVAPHVVYSTHVQGQGSAVLAKACSMSLEGIISKRIDAPYVSRRDSTWLKSKCQQRQEFVVIGFTDPQGGRVGFGSLLLGCHDSEKRLVYAGRVGTGFDDQLLNGLYKQLLALGQKDSPTALPPPARERRSAHWVKPTLVAEVRFTGWTRDGMLRHPAFIALRSDKPVSQVVRELPAQPPMMAGKRDNSAMKLSEKASPMKSRLTTSKKAADADDTIVAGVRLTHPTKVLYPEQGMTKADVADYYTVAEQWMLPHVVSRPLALVRCPAGQKGKCFFQRNWSTTLPAALGSVDVSETKAKPDLHIAVNDLAGLISLVQLGVLEVHGWNCTGGDVEHPDQLVFDLDPGPGVSWKAVVAGARSVRTVLDHLGLPTFLKTSGGKGVHITVPIAPTIGWDTAKSFCETIAKSLAQENNLFVANMRKDLRGGKIYIDYHRNGRGATAVAPYSTRARLGAPVSMPIAWEQLAKIPSASHFTVDTAGSYLKKRKRDPWQDFDERRFDLRSIVLSKTRQ